MSRSGHHVAAAVAALALILTPAPTAEVIVALRAELELRAAPPETRPNIVVILTDDQRWDTLWAMPNIGSLIVDHGVTFRNAFVVNPVCCPSRASILTGRYSHSTGVYSNTPPHGGFEAFDDTSTIATWLDAVGYRTALIGKYLNRYNESRTSYVPPGWDTWAAFTSGNGQGGYFNYSLSMQGVAASYGSDPEDYSTDVFADLADSFIRGTPASQPLFLYLSVRAPHQTAVPAPRDADAFADLPRLRPASYNEADVSDKPSYIRSLPLLRRSRRRELDAEYRSAYRTLLAVDDAVDRVVTALSETGRLSNTMIVFASDNGLLYGEHRLDGKWAPYEESIRVPLVIRYDPLTPTPRTDDRLALNIDLAPTWADLAGVPAPGADGQSLMTALGSPHSAWRSQFLIEHLDAQDVPTYCAVHDDSAIYVAYSTGEEELYDLAADPAEMENLSADPAHDALRLEMRQELAQLCNPPPPDYAIDLAHPTTMRG